MTLLDNIRKGIRPAPRRIMLYGVQGVGKSTWAAYAPKPFFVQTEDGLDNIDCERLSRPARTYKELIEVLDGLCNDPRGYQTIVNDSVDWTEALVHQSVCQRKNVTNINDIDFYEGYRFALTEWGEIIRRFNYLRAKHGMTIILLAHAEATHFKSPITDNYNRYTPKLYKWAMAKMQEWCDEVLFLTYKVYTKTDGEGFRKVVKGIGSGERVIYTSERPAYAAKNRLGLPDELPFESPETGWSTYAQYVPYYNQKKGE